MRHTGIAVAGDLPWGTHFCLLHQDPQDLFEILVPYFRAGLEQKEGCVWVLSGSVPVAEARAALARAVGNLDQYLHSGQMELVDECAWGESDPGARLDSLEARGCAALRLGGAGLCGAAGRPRVLTACTYSLAGRGAAEVVEALERHSFSLMKQAGEWRVWQSRAGELDAATERRRLEEQLRQRIEEVETVMNVAPAAIWVSHDPQCHQIIGNRMANEFYEAGDGENVSAGPAAGEPVPPRRFLLNGRELAAQELPMQEAAARNAEVRYAELEVQLPSGANIMMLGHASPLRDSAGNARGAVAAFLDITGRKRVEEERRQQREWLRVTLTSIGDAVLATDIDGRITFLNPVAARLTGWSEQEALGRPVQEVFRIIDEETRLPAEDIASRVLSGEGIVLLANHSALVTRDGREIPVEDSAAPIQDSAGQTNGVVIVFHDVTEKRRAGEALRQSEQRVRLKLDSILSPEGDIGNLELGDILDAPAIQSFMEDFYRLAHIPMSIIDLKGRVLVGVGWQDICSRFHRVHPQACRNCIESDTELTAGLHPGECKLYRCKNNLWDVATPLTIGGHHVGHLFSGQFFFDDEPVDLEFFRKQAREYGFDEEEYLSALARVPRLKKEAVETGMAFLQKLGHMLSLLSYSNIKLARALAERDRLTASWKESQETLNRAQEIAHLGSWELDLVQDRLSWSDEVYRIFGLQPQEFGATYEAFLAAVHPDDRAAVDEAYSGSLRDARSSYEIAHRIVRSGTGEIRWVHEKCEHIRGTDGAILRSIGMVQDITEERAAEEALRRVSQQRRLALEAAELGAWDYRFDTGEVFWDEACRRMFGCEGDQIPYSAAIARIHPEDRAATDDAVARALAGEAGGAYHREFRVVWPDGSVHSIASHGRVYFEGEGSERRALRFIGVSMDVTERKRAEEAVQHAQKLESIGLLAGGIAHDFNNLMVGVIGNATLAQDMLPPGSDIVDTLRRIVQSGEQAAHLTRQLLAYAGKGRFVLEPVNLTEVIFETSALAQISMSKKIAVQLYLGQDLPAVESDPSQIQQVFMNLALNAAEAIGDRAGVISISSGETNITEAEIAALRDWPVKPGRHLFLEVTDTGCGMDSATRAKIFDPFFTTKFQGRGLGLAAVAGIVRAHKGAIRLTTAPGAGATFRVLLPAMAAATAPGTPARAPENDLRGSGTVLVVDDEEVVRELARRSLERQGYEVLVAENGARAIELVRSDGDRIRLVVLDLGMPGMSGEETLPHLRKIRPGLDVIVSSGYSQAEALRQFQGARISGFIQKPYTVRELAREVKAVLA